jgi:hypothetical protein
LLPALLVDVDEDLVGVALFEAVSEHGALDVSLLQGRDELVAFNDGHLHVDVEFLELRFAMLGARLSFGILDFVFLDEELTGEVIEAWLNFVMENELLAASKYQIFGNFNT